MFTALLVVAAGLVVWHIVRAAQRDDLPRLAKQLGFERRGDSYEKRLGRATVRLSMSSVYTMSLDLSAIVGGRLVVKRRRPSGVHWVRTGVPLLDHEFEMEDAVAATAFLAPCSDVVASMFAEVSVDQSLACDDGVFTFRASVTDVVLVTEAWLTRFKMLTNVVDLDVPIEVRLRRNLLSPSPGLRLRSLQLLEREAAGSSSHAAAVVDGLRDNDVAVRIEAARQGKDAGVLRQIACDRSFDPLLRVQALAAHERVANKSDHAALLEELVTDPTQPVSLHAIKELKRYGTRAMGKRFVRLLDVAEGERQRAILDTLSVVGDASLESPLTELIGRLDDEGKWLACAALASFGSVQSVPVLRRVAEEASALTGRALRQEAESTLR